jgi:hypothetical protein
MRESLRYWLGGILPRQPPGSWQTVQITNLIGSGEYDLNSRTTITLTQMPPFIKSGLGVQSDGVTGEESGVHRATQVAIQAS